eukprot:scaffold145732_cov17-Tisochrysis_lutea.AAC.1
MAVTCSCWVVVGAQLLSHSSSTGETLDLTHEEEDDEGSAEGANASSPSAHGRRDGAGPSSTVANPQEPHTRLM